MSAAPICSDEAAFYLVLDNFYSKLLVFPLFPLRREVTSHLANNITVYAPWVNCRLSVIQERTVNLFSLRCLWVDSREIIFLRYLLPN